MVGEATAGPGVGGSGGQSEDKGAAGRPRRAGRGVDLDAPPRARPLVVFNLPLGAWPGDFASGVGNSGISVDTATPSAAASLRIVSVRPELSPCSIDQTVRIDTPERPARSLSVHPLRARSARRLSGMGLAFDIVITCRIPLYYMPVKPKVAKWLYLPARGLRFSGLRGMLPQWQPRPRCAFRP